VLELRHRESNALEELRIGQKRTVVPVLFLPTSSTTSSLVRALPSLKLMLYSLPPRFTQHSRFFDSAFTTETPTPCRPPANL
jgi:hypothetical protein